MNGLQFFPDIKDVITNAIYVENITLDGGAQNTTVFAQFDAMFGAATIFDGGSP